MSYQRLLAWMVITGILVVPFTLAQSWEISRQAQFETDFQDVAFVDAMNGWAVGNGGYIIQTTDGGKNWTRQQANIGNIQAIQFLDVNEGWAVGEMGWKGVILHTTDGGNSWNAQSTGTTGMLQGVHFVDSTRGWIVGDGGVILHTTDGGNTWNAQTSGATGNLYELYFADATHGWAVGDGGTILHTADGGTNWATQSAGQTVPFFTVYFVSNTEGWIAGAGGNIFHTTDGGTNWESQKYGPGGDFHNILFINVTEGWIVGDGILHTTDGGTTWTAQATDVTSRFSGVSFVNATEGWAVAAQGNIVQTTDGGNTWQTKNKTASNRLEGIDFADPSNGWAVGRGGLILHTSDSGSTWVQQAKGITHASLIDVVFISANEGWIVGEAPILHTTDGGTNWVQQTSWLGFRLYSVDFVNANDGWAIGDNGKILHTADGGTNWTEQTSGTSNRLLGVDFVDPDHGWAVGENDTLIRTDDGGGTWARLPSGTTRRLSDVSFVDASEGWITGDGAIVLHTTDGGDSWVEQTSGATYYFEPIIFANSDWGWAAGHDATTIYTTDGGTTWQNLASPVRRTIVDMAYDGRNTLWAVGNAGIILRYSGPPLVSEVVGPHVLALDGEGDEVRIADAPTLYTGVPFTVEAWFRAEQLQPGLNTLMANDEYEIHVAEDGTILVWDIGAGDVNGNTPVSLHRWHHVAFVNDGVSRRVFLDGAMEAFLESSTPFGDLDQELWIGNDPAPPDRGFQGFIDEIRIWNIARTQEEIQSTMDTVLQGDEPGLVGYWNFDDGTARDQTANGNHGTLTGDASIIPMAGSWPPPMPGDVSGDGSVTALDASLILKYVVGLIDEFPADVLSTPGTEPRRNYTVRLPQLNARIGERVSVSVGVQGADDMLAGGMTVQYDATKLRATGFDPTPAMNGYYWRASVNQPGEVRFAFASLEPVLEEGALLEVMFEVLPGTLGETVPLMLDRVQLSDSLSIRTLHGSVTVIPSQTVLLPNYPNPFNPETWIPYQLSESSDVTLRIYDLSGRLVRTLDLGRKQAGYYLHRDSAAHWDGRNAAGERVASGTYLLRLDAGEFSALKRMVILK